MTSNSLQKLILIAMAILFTFILKSSVMDKIQNFNERTAASRVMLAVAGELSKGSRRVASDLELLERLHDEARAIALANMPADESAKRPISDRPNDGQAS